MKIYLTVYELWFLRISVVLLTLFTISLYLDNRSQDKLIFKAISNQGIAVNNETLITQTLLNQAEINANSISTDLEIIKRIKKLEANQ